MLQAKHGMVWGLGAGLLVVGWGIWVWFCVLLDIVGDFWEEIFGKNIGKYIDILF